MSTPSIRIEPASGLSIPAMRLSSVDLPEPEGPIRPRKSPRCTSNERSCSTGTTWPPRRYDLNTLRISMSFMPASLHGHAVGDPVERLEDHPVAEREALDLHEFAQRPRAGRAHALRAPILHQEHILRAVALGERRLGHRRDGLALFRA